MRHAILYQLQSVKCLTGTVAYGLIDRRILGTFNDTVSTDDDDDDDEMCR